MTLFIRRELQEKVEGWLETQNRNLEYGGLFFGEGSRIRMALPLQNLAENKSREYLWSRSLGQVLRGLLRDACDS